MTDQLNGGCGEHSGLGSMETSWEDVAESQIGGDGGSWVYKMPEFRSSSLAAMHELSVEKSF